MSAEQLALITVVVDSALSTSAMPLAFHPDAMDRTVLVSSSDLLALLKTVGVEPRVVDFAALAAAVPAPVVKETKKEAGAVANKKPTANATSAIGGHEKEVKIGIEVKKDEDFPLWYQQVGTF